MPEETRSSEQSNDGHAHAHAPNRFAVIPTPDRLDADPAYTGRGVTVAFLDSGFHPHPDLIEPSNRIVAFHDIAGEETEHAPSASVQSWHWHGTMTSVAAAGNGRLSEGIYRGLASESNLVLVKASAQGRVLEENIARGIEWVIENRERYGIRVLNISLGGDEDIPHETSAVDRAAEQAVREGIVVIAAAGNNGLAERHTSVPPANSPSVITVGGYDDGNSFERDDDQLYGSNYGATADGILKPEIVAHAMWVAAPILPGTPAYRLAEQLSHLVSAPDYQLLRLVQSLWPNGDAPAGLLRKKPIEVRAELDALLSANKIVAAHYQHADGTSFAAPIVSSVVAQMLEANPALPPAVVKYILVSTADRLAHAPLVRQGYGLVNARRAVAEAQREQHSHEAATYGPPRIENGEVIFIFRDDVARDVALAGDFNKWSTDAVRCVKDADGLWRASIPNPGAGRYRYKFVVNGAHWTDDVGNGLKELDEYGGFNSILHIA